MTIIKPLQFWILLLTCLWFSLMPQPPQAFEAASDKVWHLFAYLVLYLSCQFAYHNRFTPLGRFVLLLIFSLVIEVIQHFIPNREFSLLDLVANAAGLLIGAAIVRIVIKSRSIKM